MATPFCVFKTLTGFGHTNSQKCGDTSVNWYDQENEPQEKNESVALQRFHFFLGLGLSAKHCKKRDVAMRHLSFYSAASNASPIAMQPNLSQPSAMMSPVRLPESRTLFTAISIALAASPSLKA